MADSTTRDPDLDEFGNPLVEPDDYSDHFIDPFEVCSSSVFILVGLCTVYVYIRLAMYHYKHGFKTHYQKLFFICTTNDILLHYAVLFRVRLPTWGVHEWYWFVRDGFFATFLGAAGPMLVQFQVVGTLLVAVNRATAITFPHRYDRFWKRYTWRICLMVYLIPFLYALPCVTNASYFLRVAWGYYIPFDNPTNDFNRFLTDYNFPVCVGVVCLSLIVNLYTCCKLYIHSKDIRRVSNRRELHFHIATVVQFLAQLINTGDLVIVNTMPMADYWFFFQCSPVFSDFANFMPLWFLLLISEETRMMVTGRLGERDGLWTRTDQASIASWNEKKRQINRIQPKDADIPQTNQPKV